MNDQPYFNYHAFQNDLYDNQRMIAFVELHLVIQRQKHPSCSLTFVHFIDGKYSHADLETISRQFIPQ